jgi:uncharacterized protein
MRVVWLVGLMSVTAVAWGASFDCKLAKTPQEKAICASPKLSAADDEMSAAYKAWMTAAPASMKTEILADQRTWLRKTARQCAGDAATITECMGDLYPVRTDELRSRIVRKGDVQFVMHEITLLSKDAADDNAGNEENPGFGTLHAAWPRAMSDAPEWQAWNKAVEGEAQSVSGADAKQLGGPWKSDWAGGGEGDVSTAFLSVGQGRVSVHIENDMMGHGAAHPNESGGNFHWMLAEKRPMKVSDVFQPGSKWASVVNARCVAGVKDQLGDLDSPYDHLSKLVADVTKSTANWELEPKGLTISFPEYTVSPRAMPVDAVTVPWSVLKPFLAQSFVVPK